MPSRLDGTYAVALAGSVGVSAAVWLIKDGKLIGNDSGGCRYVGTVLLEDGTIRFRVDMKVLPGTLAIWGGSTADVFQTHRIDLALSLAQWNSGEPIHVQSDGSYLVFRRIPDAYAPLADHGGLNIMGEMLVDAERQWAERRE